MIDRRLATDQGFRLESQDQKQFEQVTPFILTSQEHLFLGSSADPNLWTEYNHFFVPVGHLMGEMSIEDIRRERSQREYYCTHTILLGSVVLLALTLPPLDALTNATLNDPIVLGKYDETYEEIIPDPSLTQSFRELYRDRTFTVNRRNYPVLRSFA